MKMPDPSSVKTRPRRARRRPSPYARGVVVLLVAMVAFALGRATVHPKLPQVTDDPKSAPEVIRGNPLVLDGDTLDFNGLRVRLFGIDAPERDQMCQQADGTHYGCGVISREELAREISEQAVECTRRDIDRYGRVVAVCRTRKGDLGQFLVEQGMALAYRRYSEDYVKEEDLAHKLGRGVWQGNFEKPWDYRHEATEH
ncbi:MAG TPA: thermonuclease family protein [Candidatus Binatia bacterium]|jgi:endonuclease YncB( thermonuclease family)